MSTVKKICICSFCAAMCYVLPLIFHALALGWTFSPMHLPVLLCGLLCGWSYGAVCGVAGPLLSSLLGSFLGTETDLGAPLQLSWSLLNLVDNRLSTQSRQRHHSASKPSALLSPEECELTGTQLKGD